jgi:hypothetical protein
VVGRRALKPLAVPGRGADMTSLFEDEADDDDLEVLGLSLSGWRDDACFLNTALLWEEAAYIMVVS